MLTESEIIQRALGENRNVTENASYMEQLVSKWGKSGLLEGVQVRGRNDRHRLHTLVTMYENQMNALRSGDALLEDTRSSNAGNFTKFVFPVLRNVFPNLIANEIVSVQPMTAPHGAVFYLDYIYGTTKGSTQAGTVFPLNFDKNYTSELVENEILATGDGANLGGAGTALAATASFSPMRPLDANRGFSVVITASDATTGAVLQTATDNGTGGFTFSPAGGSTAGTINYSNGAIAGFKFQNAPALGNLIRITYSYDGEMNTKMPQMQLDVKQALISANPHRIKAVWSPEAAEDLRSQHGIEAESEMVASVANEIALEIDRKIIGELFAASTSTQATFNRVPPAGIAELDHLRSLLSRVSDVSAQIHKKTMRAAANFIVTSPRIGAMLSQLQTHGDYRTIWSSDTSTPYGAADAGRPLVQHGQYGIYKAGTLANKWMIYEDPYFQEDYMMLGLKGQSYLDAGYVWAPYIPLSVSTTFMDPADNTIRKSLRTRYGSKLLRANYYGQVRVQNL